MPAFTFYYVQFHFLILSLSIKFTFSEVHFHFQVKSEPCRAPGAIVCPQHFTLCGGDTCIDRCVEMFSETGKQLGLYCSVLLFCSSPVFYSASSCSVLLFCSSPGFCSPDPILLCSLLTSLLFSCTIWWVECFRQTSHANKKNSNSGEIVIFPF